MTNFRGITIRHSLIFSALGVLIILLIILFSTNYYINKVSGEYENMQLLDEIKKKELKIHNLEKDFLIYETINPKFYLSGNSNYISDINKKLKEINSITLNLKTSNFSENKEFYKMLNEVVIIYDDYKKDLNVLNELILQKGFKDYGLIGEMRNKIHNVEDLVNERNDLHSTKYMLLLRRHEKDYLLRKDLKYKDKFDKTYNEFVGFLKLRNSDADKKLIKTLKEYNSLFNDVIRIDTKIGRTNKDGILKEIVSNNKASSKLLSNLLPIAKQESASQIKSAIISLYAIITILSLLIVITLFNVSKRIVKSVKSLETYVSKLGEGELPEMIKIKQEDEIGKMKHSINNLTDNLKRTRDFAVAVGSGDFKKEIDVFNNKGDLGNSLVDMRKRLLKVSEERTVQKKKDDQRIWSNEGLTIFADLLRKDHSSIEDMSYEIISKLVKYIEANQGYIFLKEKIDNQDYLNLKAAYAFDRRKFADKKILPGEGMVGTCALEMETIYMTDIPEEYINITSGLGDANPRTLLIVPLKVEDKIIGVIELASFEEIPEFKVIFVEKVAESIASHIANIQINIKTNELLEQTKSQAQELTEKEEEMRQNMEELKITQENMSVREEELLNEIEDLKDKLRNIEQ